LIIRTRTHRVSSNYPAGMSLLFSWERSNLYDSDVSLLKGSNWLNDNVITFAFEYLSHKQFADSKKVNFIDAGSSFIIMHEKDMEDLQDTVEGCRISADKYLFFPVSDKNPYSDVPGGGHWALLMFDCEKKKFYYIDSARTMNIRNGRQLAEQVARFVLPQHFESEKNKKEGSKLEKDVPEKKKFGLPEDRKSVV
jgi:Ulp1 family protease